MTQTRETRLTLGGLVTQPNKYLAEPGSLKQAKNVMVRQPGVVEPRLGFENLVDPGDVGTPTPRAIYAHPENPVLVTSFDDDATTETCLNSTYVSLAPSTNLEVLDEAGNNFTTRGAVALARNRLLLDSRCSGATDPASPPQMVRVIDPDELAVARRGGLIPPSWIDASSGGAGAAVEDTKWVGYRAHFEREHADGYIQIGPVSPVVLYQNFSGDTAKVDLTIYWSRIADGNDWVREGDLLRVYRTDNAASKDEVGDTMRLAVTVELDATAISNFSVSAADITSDDGLDAFLYTNSGQGGSTESKWFPPSASDMVVFRDVVWYVSPFSPRSFELRVPGKWGDFASGAPGRETGVGSFVLSTTTTNGNASFTVSADDKVGLSPGQVVIEDSSGAFGPGTRVDNVVGTTVTMSAPAAVSGATTFRVGDVVEINGEKYPAHSPARLMKAIAQASLANEYEYPAWVFASQALVKSVSSLVDVAVDGVALTIIAPSFSTDFVNTSSVCSVRASNGSKWSPALPGLSSSPAFLGTDDQRRNRGHFSEIQEPEAVPVLNYRFFGSGTLLKFIAVEDVMLAFCSDGTYACTGDGETWDIRPFDLALRLLHRNAVDVINGTVWALTNRGVVAISGGQVQEVSTPFIGNRIRELEQAFKSYLEPLTNTSVGAYNVMLRCEPTHNEVWLRYRADDGEGVTLIFNIETKTWSEVTGAAENPTALGYSLQQRSILVGAERVTGKQTLRTSYDDASTDPGERMAGAVVELNPFGGGDLNTRKDWLQAVYDLEFLEGTGALQIRPFFGDVTYPAPYSITAQAGDVEHVVSVPRNAARGKQLSPGFEVTGSAGTNTAATWKLSGVTVKFRVASPDTRRQ